VTARAVVRPLVAVATYRRGVFLLLGGVVLLPYALLAAVFVQMLGEASAPRPAIGVLVLGSVAIGAVPPFLTGTRALEIAAARALLDVDLPEPAGPGIDRETRLRGALWFAAHLVTGGLVGLALLIAVPMALIFITQQFGVGREALAGLQIGPLDARDNGWVTLAGLVLLIALVYLVAGLGALTTMMAPVLLGPSQTERIAALEARANRLAERNRLARELHDSVGHALTVTTLQAAAAQELLDRDPEFARRALQQIQEVGRSAMADLDYALGVLRDRDASTRPGGDLVPQRSLADLQRLVGETRATGLAVTIDVAGAVDTLPASLSREGYRILQEGLTNAARHAHRQPVRLRLDRADGSLTIELTNPIAGTAGRGDLRSSDPGVRSGKGLPGIRERAALLGGWMTAGPDGGTWRLLVELPIDRERLR
jgi:signal transduction histidine kinase